MPNVFQNTTLIFFYLIFLIIKWGKKIDFKVHKNKTAAFENLFLPPQGVQCILSLRDEKKYKLYKNMLNIYFSAWRWRWWARFRDIGQRMLQDGQGNKNVVVFKLKIQDIISSWFWTHLSSFTVVLQRTNI